LPLTYTIAASGSTNDALHWRKVMRLALGPPYAMRDVERAQAAVRIDDATRARADLSPLIGRIENYDNDEWRETAPVDVMAECRFARRAVSIESLGGFGIDRRTRAQLRDALLRCLAAAGGYDYEPAPYAFASHHCSRE
jgi:hypothetical protein